MTLSDGRKKKNLNKQSLFCVASKTSKFTMFMKLNLSINLRIYWRNIRTSAVYCALVRSLC